MGTHDVEKSMPERNEDANRPSQSDGRVKVVVSGLKGNEVTTGTAGLVVAWVAVESMAAIEKAVEWSLKGGGGGGIPGINRKKMGSKRQ